MNRSTVVALALFGLLIGVGESSAQTLPPGFSEQIVFSGLEDPTVVEFASDGRVFVAEKSGLIKLFPGLASTTPTIFADLRTNVHNFWDRGLLGMALHPDFPTTPYVYVLYTHDAPVGGTAPRWGTPGGTDDPCPTPPGANTDGCVVSGRLSRLTASGNVMVGAETVLLEGWCQQFPTHSVGALAFGPDGALYVSGGDGASFTFVDYGQAGSPLNPCGDPPAGVGGTQTPPTAEGGALRSQSLERPVGEPVVLNGTILRLDPMTGEGMPDNPLAASPDPIARRIVAYGLRNPFRITTRPNTPEVWVGDVGWNVWEEINRIADPTAGVANFGWPCYEGDGRQPGYDAADLSLCESLFGRAGAVTLPTFSYRHADPVVAGEPCPVGSSSVTGLAFYTEGDYPEAYDGALFFADFSRSCIWAILDPTGPAPSFQTFAVPGVGPVYLATGPNGDVFYVGLDGTVRRIVHAANQAPVAVAQATPTSGTSPLTVVFDASASSDPDPGDTITFAWDLDGDGQFDDSTAAQPSWQFTAAGAHTVRLLVTDNRGASSTTSVVVTVGTPNLAPTATIVAPLASAQWAVGDVINFSGGATDPEDGPLPSSSLTWTVLLHHCPSDCHTHPFTAFVGVAAGSFNAPDHDYPSHLELQLTATDSQGATSVQSVLLFPRTSVLSFQTDPAGLQLALGSSVDTTPFDRTVIVGSVNSVSAPSPQSLGGTLYTFSAWSDAGAPTHTIVAGPMAATYTATYTSAATVTYRASSDFSSTQGFRNWFYLYGAGTPMTFVDGVAWQGNETYLLLWDSGGHPGGGADAVRRWVAPQGGSATITGSARDLDPSCGGGVVVSIRRNTTMLWQQTLANGNTAGIPFELTTAVGAGDNVDFVINRGANNDCDATGFDPTIVFTPGGPADTTPPGRSGGAPTGTLAAGTTQATLSLTTDESAICRYATTAGVAYAAMPTGFTTTGGTAHATTVTGLADGGSYSFFVRCQDLAGNANPDDMVIGFSVALGGGSTTYRASTDFSSTQGFRNWFYLYGAGTPMTFVDGDAWQGNETYLLLWDSGGHPGGGADAVRRWVAPEEGAVTITGSAMDLDSSCGGGVVVSIRRNGMVLWQQTLANGDAAGVPFDVVTAVLAGDNVDFVINRGANNDCDATGFDPTIVFTPQ